ncbi:hypothetical protein ABZZ36_42215 [Actinacidiphila glaucinigra]|uniref:hypothetical protein n=1 Tax=Actinacidiphila glaucinigra TaxID=235986 RepID=UPI0033B10C94
MPQRRYANIAAVVVLAAAVTSCGTLAEREDAASTTVTRFEQALTAQQATELCAALAPATRDELEQSAKQPCVRAITKSDIPVAGAVHTVDVYGGQARVALEHDTVFLAHFPTGWKISAAGCTSQLGQPYRCEIRGR